MPLVVTMGEPAGIGPELALKAWHTCKDNPQLAFAYLGDPGDLMARAELAGIPTPVQVVAIEEINTTFERALPVVAVQLTRPSVAGTPDLQNAPQVISAIAQAVRLIQQGAVRAMVTGPIQKSSLYDAGFEYSGHTEYLAHLACKEFPSTAKTPILPVMMLACDELRVIPATIHVALRDVPALLTRELLVETTRVAAHDLAARFGITTPRIVFAGLNPHASEAGAMGEEEKEIIAPAVEMLVREGFKVSGPLPADTLFHKAARRQYDVVIAMYHDQALVPIKTIAFDSAVNVTLGLPFVRTSPDHGTALDIAGSGKVDPASFLAALKMADTLSRNIQA